MAHPVKLSDALVLDARLTAEVAERSISGQIEFWAQLGRSMEPLLRGDTALALERAGSMRSMSESIAEVGTAAGKERLEGYLGALPFPHYEPAEEPGWLVRIDEDGARTIGRFVNRAFEPR